MIPLAHGPIISLQKLKQYDFNQIFKKCKTQNYNDKKRSLKCT
ncbi:hypothetical protein CLSA_c37950 [Clostridium saccharobutylicum DSM 13864]|uniref:Uncharacterized protein n=1 Tax=Clostridium saccharobutylicum DSM 13864 TaxID=1345695 RepID=U5MYM6_CLOSA|nr:hypothetical protein CLSA_c37950 [Clostridium saccharobutylicum DSM 13864]